MHKSKQIKSDEKNKAWKCRACNVGFSIPTFIYPAPKNVNNKWTLHHENKITGSVEEVAACPNCLSEEIEPVITQVI